jgi:hypothetical protein
MTARDHVDTDVEAVPGYPPLELQREEAAATAAPLPHCTRPSMAGALAADRTRPARNARNLR